MLNSAFKHYGRGTLSTGFTNVIGNGIIQKLQRKTDGLVHAIGSVVQAWALSPKLAKLSPSC